MPDTLERIEGCLIGVAAGDAMGMPSSMMSPQRIKQLFGYIDRFLPAPPGHILHNGLRAGETTDDTQQTLILADSIIAKKIIDPEDIARRLIAWAEASHAFTSMLVGPSSLRALGAIRSGRPITESGKSGDTNGAAMRIAPVGIYGRGELDRTLDAVERACLPTHNTNIAIAGAAAVALAVGLGIRGVADPDVLIQEAMQIAELGLKRGNIWYGASILERTRLALQIVNAPTDRETKMISLYDLVGTGVQMAETVPTSLAIVKMAKGDPVEAVILAANMGGDCDTIGAIVGAICGAIKGSAAFPSEWVNLLQETNGYDFAAYAEKLYRVVQ